METIAKEEKIRKQIKAFIKSRGSQITQSKTDAWLAWLEKQGEQNPYSGVSFKYNGHTWGMCARDNGVDILCDKQLFKHLEKQDEQNNLIELQEAYTEIGRLVEENYRLKKQGEQKAVEWSEEDERMYRVLHNLIYGTPYFNLRKESSDWLESLKDRVMLQPKQEWKQENISDLTDFENAMMHIGGSFFGENAGLDPNDTNVIKEQANLLLKLVEQKHAWSEEDENNILFLTSIIEECFKDKEKITLCGDTVCANFTKEDVINRLKSLRPHTTWKPSDAQMDALWDSIKHNLQLHPVLKSLYNDLKKLREDKK